MTKIIVDKTTEEIKQILRNNYPTKESGRKFHCISAGENRAILFFSIRFIFQHQLFYQSSTLL